MVMEYLEGADLGQIAKQRAPLPIAIAVGYVLEAIAGLSEAHRAGIVHRDLKPGNLFLARRDDGSEIVKVLDFGIAKSLAGGPALTKEGFVLGSPNYMSPEQLQSSRSVDARTDVWALGAILYELLSGRPPFEGSSIEERLRAILTGKRLPLSELRADVPVELAAVIDECLTTDRERRPSDLGQLARRLEPFGPAAARQMAQKPTLPHKKLGLVALVLLVLAVVVVLATRARAW
jgi:serine/threonine-protein kinase